MTLHDAMYTLYFAPDNASLIVRIVLEELELAYHTVLVDRVSQEQKSEHYRRLNPRGLIPVLIMDDQPIFETAAIVLALADRHGALAPPVDHPERAGFLKWLFFLSNGLHTNLRQCFYPAQYVGGEAAARADFQRRATGRVLADLAIIEGQLRDGGQSPLGGFGFSVADIYLGVCLRWLQLYPLGAECRPDLTAFPRLRVLARRMQTRPALERACLSEGIPPPFLLDPDYPDGTQGAAL